MKTLNMGLISKAIFVIKPNLNVQNSPGKINNCIILSVIASGKIYENAQLLPVN